MNFKDRLAKIIHPLEVEFSDIAFYGRIDPQKKVNSPCARFYHEIDFVQQFIDLFPDKAEKWQELAIKAAETVMAKIEEDPKGAVEAGEKILAPIAKEAKKYTIYCVGHAHIDMNWMWGWQETVNVTHDTFMTMDKVMDEFPQFRYSQSQASTYEAMRKYCPNIFEMIKKRIKEGRWEVTASTWVESDMNMISGESLCRHLLYTREFFKKYFDMDPEDVKIGYFPDTFGHFWTAPSILTKGGVSRYYHMRPSHGIPMLYKWQAPDGSQVLAFNERDSYGGNFSPRMVKFMVDFCKETGAKNYMYTYGVGDHGGGPTRFDIRLADELLSWPVYPTVKPATTDDFFTAIEKENLDLPVVNSDTNFLLEGCYTAESEIKHANKVSESIIPEAEALACVSSAYGDMEYPKDLIYEAWINTLFNHFHDILPGSGIRDTVTYAIGKFQDTRAAASAIRTRAYRAIAEKVDTSFIVGRGFMGNGLGDGLGSGVGFATDYTDYTSRGAGSKGAEPVVVFNTKPWRRKEQIIVEVWNKDLKDDSFETWNNCLRGWHIVVTDKDGNEQVGQAVETGTFWGPHHFVKVAFEADVPAFGYNVYYIDQTRCDPERDKSKDVRDSGVFMKMMHIPVSENYQGDNCIENEFLKVKFDIHTGAICGVTDKETGVEYVQPGKLFGFLEGGVEAPNIMSAWIVGIVNDVTPLTTGGNFERILNGPNKVTLRRTVKYGNSPVTIDISLAKGSRKIDFKVKTRWVEIGSKDKGIPMLRAVFPFNTKGGQPTYEIAFGNQQRPQSAQVIPALKWADLSCDDYGMTLVNNDKYGHICENDTMYLQLIRSSYEPDCLPEVRDHEITYSVIFHKGACDTVEATKAGENYNAPMKGVSTTVHEGTLPAAKSYAEVLTDGAFISAIKRAEDEKGIILRAFSISDKNLTLKVKLAEELAPAGSAAIETDVLERPLAKNTASFKDGVLTVKLPKRSNVTVKIG
ncbi:MAG: alpha-mannosidase [Abditibacteriota bacterium]|nr:alpha-mannosidase [Abditibacteriota bacterium]